MRIALLGYGKMGKVVERIALARGHKVVLKIDKNSGPYNIQLADVAIDFSAPEAAVGNISECLDNGVPIVSGTTGWLDAYDSIVNLCTERDGAFLYASNFSLGMNIFFALNRKLARVLNKQDGYKARIHEIHHAQKLDAPSGTAISLAQGIIEESNYENWALVDSDDFANDKINISAERRGEVPGTHTVAYSSEADKIEITHEAFNREGFGLGAVMAAEWLRGKTGIYTMNDVLNIG